MCVLQEGLLLSELAGHLLTLYPQVTNLQRGREGGEWLNDCYFSSSGSGKGKGLAYAPEKDSCIQAVLWRLQSIPT